MLVCRNDETDRLEEARARQLKNNHEMKENFTIEVDNLMAHQQYVKAAKLYGKKQVDLSYPIGSRPSRR